MFKKIFPKFTIPLLVFLAMVSNCYFLISKNIESPLNELALLNSKYGLIAAEPIDKNEIQVADSLFRRVNLNASIMSILKPKKELIVQLKNNNNADLTNIFLLKLRTDSDLEEIAKAYEDLNIIRYAEPNFSLELNSEDITPDDENKDGQDTAQSFNDDTKKSVIVAIIDSGVDVEHDDLKGRTIQGWDFVNNDNIPEDTLGHGTHLAGIIANNSSSAIIMPLRLTDGKNGRLSDLIKAIRFAIYKNAKIVNLSLGLFQQSRILKEAIDYANQKNVFIIAAAGNYNSDEKYFPAAYTKVFSVAALNKKGQKLYQSNYGKWVDYSIVAQDIYSALPNNQYGYRTGTSQAAAFLTASVADILGENPNIDLKTLSAELQKKSELIQSGDYAGLLGRKLLQNNS